jgi:hypothetical protein
MKTQIQTTAHLRFLPPASILRAPLLRHWMDATAKRALALHNHWLTVCTVIALAAR